MSLEGGGGKVPPSRGQNFPRQISRYAPECSKSFGIIDLLVLDPFLGYYNIPNLQFSPFCLRCGAGLYRCTKVREGVTKIHTLAAMAAKKAA